MLKWVKAFSLVCACLSALPSVCMSCRRQLKMLQERDKLVNNYYDMGSSYGKPTPLVLLPLAEMLTTKTDNSLLW